MAATKVTTADFGELALVTLHDAARAGRARVMSSSVVVAVPLFGVFRTDVQLARAETVTGDGRGGGGRRSTVATKVTSKDFCALAVVT